MPPTGRPARPGSRRPRRTRPPKPAGRTLSPAEGLLWEMLRDERLAGLTFARRHPHRRFVLDFFCADAGVVVQLLGEREAQGDRLRKADLDARALEAEGLVIVRVPEARVMADLPGVLADIAKAAVGRRNHHWIRVSDTGRLLLPDVDDVQGVLDQVDPDALP